MRSTTAAGKTDENLQPDRKTAFWEFHSILHKESFRAIAKLLCETAGKLIGADASYTAIINPAGGKTEVSFWDSSNQKYTISSVLPPYISDSSGNIKKISKPFYQNALTADTGREYYAAGDGTSARNLLTIPLLMDNCALGFIGLMNKPGGFTDNDVSKAGDLSHLAAIAIARNISLEMLSSRERQYRDLFEHAGESIVVNDLRGVFLDVNKKACETLGYSKSELLGKNVRDIMHPDRITGLSALLNNTRSKGEVVFETACLHKDGYIIDLEISSRFFYYYGHKTVLTLAKDISERKRAEDSLTHDKDRLESLWNIYRHRTEGVKDLLDYVLEEALRLTGNRAGNVYRRYYDAKKNIFVLETWGRDMDRDACVITGPRTPAPSLTGIWGEALTRRSPILLNSEEAFKEATGNFPERETKDLRYLAVPIFLSEQDAAVLVMERKTGSYTDSDAEQLSLLVNSVLELVRRKEREEEFTKNRLILNAIMNSSPDAITAKDLSGRYTILNLCASALMHKKVEEVLGKRDAELFPPEKARKIREIEKNILANRRVETFEEEAGAGDKKRVFLVTKGPLLDDTGKVMGLFSHARDITEHKQLETELINTQKTESLSVMAAGIAHDFNNMLTAVMGNTSLALESVPPKSQLFRLLNNTLKASRTAQELTHQLQTFAKEEDGAVKNTLDLPRVIKEAAALAASGARTKFVFDFNSDTPTVKGSEGQLKQVINNLALNASQAMEQGGTITIKTAAVNIQERITPRLKPGAYARITVSDTGPGIPQRHLGKIFDPYFSTKKSGGGLGLSMVYSIIKNHGGYIGVVSKEGEGAIFVIYLPAAGIGTVCKNQKQKPPKTGKGRILVMDDDKFVLEVLTLMLRRLGYTTETAGDGRAAIAAYTRAAAGKRPFRAVVLDLTIPGGMGGDEAARRLRAIDPNIKLVLSSGYSNSTITANSAEHSFDTVLPKPYHIREVGEIMAKLLKSGRRTAGRRGSHAVR